VRDSRSVSSSIVANYPISVSNSMTDPEDEFSAAASFVSLGSQ